MDDATVEPLGFFTLDALRAGWYSVWRQLVRLFPAGVVIGAVAGALAALGMAGASALVIVLGALAVFLWSAVLTARFTIQWAEMWYGATLTGTVRVWWGVFWRVLVASIVIAFILAPPNFVALSLSTAFADSALGLLGHALTVLLALANFGASVLATGWAMSRVAVGQIVRGEAVAGVADADVSAAPAPAVPVATLAAPAPVIAVEPVPAMAAAAPAAAPGSVAPALVAPPAAEAPAARPAAAVATRPAAAVAARPDAAGDRRQCPKCGLYETERGTVIGWYCRICGWREGKGR